MKIPANNIYNAKNIVKSSNENVYVPETILFRKRDDGMYLTWKEPDQSISSQYDMIYTALCKWISGTDMISVTAIFTYDTNGSILKRDFGVNGIVGSAMPESASIMDQGEYSSIIGYVKDSFIDSNTGLPTDFNALGWSPKYRHDPSNMKPANDPIINNNKSLSWVADIDAEYYHITLQRKNTTNNWDNITFGIYTSHKIIHTANYEALTGYINSGEVYRYKIIAVSSDIDKTPNSFPTYTEEFEG